MASNSDKLEIEQNLSFQRRFWKVQRILWLLVIVLLIAAFLGFFGGEGVLQKSVAKSNESRLIVEYPAYERLKAPSSLTLTAVNTPKDTTKISVSREFLDAVQIEHITPEPDSVQADSREITYDFNVAPGMRELKVTIDMSFQEFGPVSGSFHLVDSPAVTTKQFVYP
jgi:hypothetical protein